MVGDLCSFPWLIHRDLCKENILKWQVYDPMNFMLLIFLAIDFKYKYSSI